MSEIYSESALFSEFRHKKNAPTINIDALFYTSNLKFQIALFYENLYIIQEVLSCNSYRTFKFESYADIA